MTKLDIKRDVKERKNRKGCVKAVVKIVNYENG